MEQDTTPHTIVVEEEEKEEEEEDCVDASNDSTPWHLFCIKCPKEEIVFLCQIVVLYTVIVISIYNLSVGHDDSNLWTALLSSSLGYLLPNPTLRRNDDCDDHFHHTIPQFDYFHVRIPQDRSQWNENGCYVHVVARLRLSNFRLLVSFPLRSPRRDGPDAGIQHPIRIHGRRGVLYSG